MQKKITHFSIHKTAVTAAVVMAVAMLPIIVLMVIPSLFASNSGGLGILMLVIFPLFYLIMGYIFTALFCWVYNFLVKKGLPGVTFTLGDQS